MGLYVQFLHLPSLTLHIFLTPLSLWSLSLEMGVCDTSAPFRVEHSLVSFSLYLVQLWVSVVMAIDHK